jgi:hypothetical protein
MGRTLAFCLKHLYPIFTKPNATDVSYRRRGCAYRLINLLAVASAGGCLCWRGLIDMNV